MVLKINTIYFALAFCLSMPSFAQKKKEDYDPKKTYSPTQLKEDFTFLRKCLDESHPGLNWYISKDSLDGIFDGFEKNLNENLTERQFRNRLFPVLGEIRCGHSSLANSKERMKYLEKNKTKYLPFEIIALSNLSVQTPVYQLFIKENKSKDSTIKKGNEIMSIDGVSSKDIIKTMANSFLSDGYNQTHKYHILKENFQMWYPRMFEEKDTFLVEIRDSIGQIRELKMPCINEKMFPFSKKNEAKKTYIYNTKKNKLTFDLDEKNKNIGILTVKSFTMKGYPKLYRKTFRYLKEHKIEHLVLDLRGNGGGMIFHPGHLLSYLINEKEQAYTYREAKNPSFLEKVEGKGKGLKFTKWVFPKFREKWGVKTVKNDSIFHITIQNRVREKNHYNGKLYILIDGGCFSATAYTAAFLKKHKRGLFIGEETGGGEKGCNAMVMNYLELPNTKLRYRFPFFRVEHNVTPQAIGRGVFPDVNIKYDKKSRLEDKDLEMEKVRMVVENIFVPTGI